MKKQYILLVLIFWMGVIFFFSSQTYEQQSLTHQLASFRNTPLEQMLQGYYFYYGGNEVSVYALGIEGFLEFIIRKGAHFCIFFVLGLLTYALLQYKWNKSFKTIIISFVFVVLYACFDEFHQLLTGDRTALWQDVVLDSIGGLCGILSLTLYNYIKNDKLDKK